MKLHLVTALSALLLCLAGPALGQIPKGYEGARDGPVPELDVRPELRRLLDLSINKRVVGPVVAGQPATFVLQVINSGNVVVNAGMAVQVVDVLPNGFSAPVTGSGSGWSCSPVGTSLICNWNGGPIQAGAPFPPITMTAVAGAQESYQNCARVRLTRAQDQRPGNDNSCVNGRIEKPQGGRYNVGARKSGPPSVSLGQTATFTIQVTNLGPSPVSAAAGLTVTDTVPVGFTNVTASGVGWTCIVAGAQPAQVTCTYGGPPVSANLQFPMLTITGTAAKDGPFLQCADAVFRNQTDSNPRDNRACVEGRVTQGDKTGYDLSIRKTYKSPSKPGGPVTFTLTPFNNGPSTISAASGVQVTDTLPTNFAPPISGVGTNWSCVTNSTGGGAPWTVVCDYTGPSVGVGALPVIEISAAVSKPGSFTNCADINVRAGRDPNPRDNRACVNGEVSGPANKKPDIAITKTALDQPWSWPAGTGVYRFLISNVGDTAVPAGHVVTLTETLPAGMVLISMPGAWTCSPPVGTAGPATIVCAFLLTTALNPTAFVQFDMTVGFNGQKEPSYQNCASVVVGGRDGPWPEVNMANNRDCEPTEVGGGGGGGMDIGIDKAGPTALSLGQTGTYTLSVSNASNAPLDLNTYSAPPFVTVYTPVITVTDTLPSIFNPPASASGGPNWNCTATGLSISCTYVGGGIIPPGGALPPITISATVGSPGSGEQCATASIGGAWFYVDLKQGNNKDCVQVVVRSPPQPINLTADKDPIGAWPGGSGSFWFRLSATNTSTNPVPAGTGLTIIDNLPAGMRLDSQAGSFTCTPVGLIGPGPVTCTLTLSAPMPAGAMEIADLQVSYVGALNPTYENCITLSASVPETTLGDNSDCALATFNPPVAPSLQIEKVVDQDCSGSAPYTGCKFMIRIFNTGGASYAGPLTFTDTVLGPSGVTLSGVSLASPLPPGWTCTGAQPATCTIASVTIASNSHLTIPLFMTINGAIPPIQNCAALTAPVTAQSCVSMGSTHHDLAIDSSFVEEFEAVNGGRFDFSISSTPNLSNGPQLVFNGAVTTPATLSPRIVTTPLWSCSGPWSGFICTLNVTPGAYSGSVIPLGLRTYYSPNFVGQPVTFTGQIQMNGNTDPVPANNTKTVTTVLP